MPTRPAADHGTRDDADFREEIEAHLAIEQDRRIAEGLSPADARDAAHRAFGSVTASQERFYEARRWRPVDQLRQDLRYAWRGLWRNPTFVVTTVATLALALSLVTVVFTIFNAYVLRPFAVHDPDSLYQIAWRSQDRSSSRFVWRDYLAIADRRDLFDVAIAEAHWPVASDGRRLDTVFVSGNYFLTLGVRMHLGRGLADFDARAPGGDPVAVLSHRTWTRLLDSDPAAIGRPLLLNGHRFTIVGVTRPEFTGLDDSPRDLWLPVTMFPTLTGQDLFGTDLSGGSPFGAEGGVRETLVTVRLRRDVAVERAQGALTPLLARAFDERAEKQQAVRAEMRSQATPAPLSLDLIVVLSPVFGAFLLVLVAACANVSNVMLARANARHREIAVRLSLGASRGRVVRQLLTEGLLIALLAGLVGLALAQVMLRAGLAAFFNVLPPAAAAALRVMPLEFDARVFGFSLVVAAGATLFFALLPALQATRLSLTSALRGEASATLRGSRLRQMLVVSQVAVSLLLLVPALTLVRGGARLDTTDLGFDTHGVLSVNQRGNAAPMIGRAAEALRADPRVEQVAVTTYNPLFERVRRIAVAPGPGLRDTASGPASETASGQASGSAADARAATPLTAMRYNFVSPEYFPLLKIPVIRGRGFREQEGLAEASVGIVSAATANTFWPDADAIGRTIRIQRSTTPGIDDLPGYADVTIIGMVPDVVSGMVFDGQDASHLYLPTSPSGTHATALLARVRSAQDGRPETIGRMLERAHPDPLLFETVPLAELVAHQLFPIRVASWIGSLLGAIALVLSVSGLFGVLTYTLSQRTREIGIRMALGATAASVVRLVMRQCAWLAAIGAAVGLGLAFAVMKTVSALVPLANLSLLDGAAFAIGVVLAVASALLAAWHPARRATRLDPSRTLRADS